MSEEQRKREEVKEKQKNFWEEKKHLVRSEIHKIIDYIFAKKYCSFKFVYSNDFSVRLELILGLSNNWHPINSSKLI